MARKNKPHAVQEIPDWLDDLGDLSDVVAASKRKTGNLSEPEAEAELPDDFFDNLPDLPDEDEIPIEEPAAEIDPLNTTGLQDIDTLLASYDYEPPLPSAGELVAGSAEFDKLFSQDEVELIETRRRQSGRPGDLSGLSPDAPEWLTELGASVDEVSAGAIVRKQTQREKPLDELSDRLQALHERGLDLPAGQDAGRSEVLKTLLPGVDEVLPSAPIKTTQIDRSGDLVLSDAQRDKINLLNTLVGAEEGGSARRQTTPPPLT